MVFWVENMFDEPHSKVDIYTYTLTLRWSVIIKLGVTMARYSCYYYCI